MTSILTSIIDNIFSFKEDKQNSINLNTAEEYYNKNGWNFNSSIRFSHEYVKQFSFVDHESSSNFMTSALLYVYQNNKELNHNNQVHFELEVNNGYNTKKSLDVINIHVYSNDEQTMPIDCYNLCVLFDKQYETTIATNTTKSTTKF